MHVGWRAKEIYCKCALNTKSVENNKNFNENISPPGRFHFALRPISSTMSFIGATTQSSESFGASGAHSTLGSELNYPNPIDTAHSFATTTSLSHHLSVSLSIYLSSRGPVLHCRLTFIRSPAKRSSAIGQHKHSSIQRRQQQPLSCSSDDNPPASITSSCYI